MHTRKNNPLTIPPVSHKQAQEKITALGLMIFFAATLFYGYDYLLRIYPNIMEPDLLLHFHTTAFGYSLITVFYYFAYTPLQIPAGVFVDKVGPRRALIMGCITVLVGALIFTTTTTLWVALLGRFLIGAGCAFAFITPLKIAAVWLPKKYFSVAAGFVTGFGMIIGVFTESGSILYLQHHGYKSTLIFPVYAGIAVLILLFIFIREKPKAFAKDLNSTDEVSAHSYKQLWSYVRLLLRNPQMWLIGIVGLLLYLPSSVFLDAWTIPYLQSADHFTAAEAGHGASLMLIGWIVSSTISGVISEYFKSRKIPLIFSAIAATIICSILLYVPHLSTTLVFALLFLFGFSCGPQPLCFTLGKENCKRRIAGTAVAFTNAVIMMGGFVFQPVVGKLLNIGWHGTMTKSGVHLYTGHDFMMSLSIVPIGLLLSLIITLFIKETYHISHTQPSQTQ